MAAIKKDRKITENSMKLFIAPNKHKKNRTLLTISMEFYKDVLCIGVQSI